MVCPSSWSRNIGVLFVLAVIGSQASTAQEPSSKNTDRLSLVSALADTRSRSAAISLSALANLHVPNVDLDVTWSGLRGDILDRTDPDQIDLALLDMGGVDRANFDKQRGLRAVMKFWQRDRLPDGETSPDQPGYLLAARDSLSPDIVSDLVGAILEDKVLLKASGIDLERRVPSVSMADLPLPLHQGVDDYLSDQGIPLPTGNVMLRPEVDLTHSFAVYFDTNDSRLERDDIAVVAEACKFAATLDRARFVISGHTDTVGTETYNDWLAARRSERVASAIRNDPRFRESLSVLDFGERNLAIPTGDGVPEAMNRRVVITIIPDV